MWFAYPSYVAMFEPLACQLRRYTPVALLVFLVAACGSDGPQSAFVLRDSAGVTIAESLGPAWEEAATWHLSAVPRLVIGDDETVPENLFTRVVGAFRTGDGRIVVTNMHHPPQIRVFDSGGRLLTTLGGEGEGPGEFRAIWKVYGTSADTVVVVEFFDTRLHFFSLDGTFGRTVRSRLNQATGGTLGALITWGRFSDNSFLARPNNQCPGSYQGVGRGEDAWLRVSDEGVRLDTIAVLPGGECFLGDDELGGRIMFGRTTTVLAHSDRLYVGTADTWQIDVYDLGGTLRQRIRRAHEPRPVTQADLEARQQELLDRVQSEERRRSLRRRFESVPHAESLPPYDLLMADAADNLWIREYASPLDTVARWSVFEPHGRFLGMVEMAPEFRPHDIGADYVLGVWKDELDVESVRLYDLIKPRGSQIRR